MLVIQYIVSYGDTANVFSSQELELHCCTLLLCLGYIFSLVSSFSCNSHKLNRYILITLPALILCEIVEELDLDKLS